jgi:hypothetical protein
MRKFIAIGLIGVTLTAVSATARAGDEAEAFILGTLVGSALADNGHGTRIHVSHHAHAGAFHQSRGARAYARGYRDAKRALRYAPPPKAYRHGYRHSRAYGYRHDRHAWPYAVRRPAAREIYRQGYRDARRDVRRAERRHERWDEHREQRHGNSRDASRDTRQGGRPARHEDRRRH